MSSELSKRVVKRYLKEVRENTKPINKPRGISKSILKNYGESESPVDESVEPSYRDVLPSVVFNPTPNEVGMLNLVETGKGLERAIDQQIPKDKGYGVVNNLSQYLIRTDHDEEDSIK